MALNSVLPWDPGHQQELRNRDSSPTRQFTDTHFEDSSPTELKTVHQQN